MVFLLYIYVRTPNQSHYPACLRVRVKRERKGKMKKGGKLRRKKVRNDKKRGEMTLNKTKSWKPFLKPGLIMYKLVSKERGGINQIFIGLHTCPLFTKS